MFPLSTQYRPLLAREIKIGRKRASTDIANLVFNRHNQRFNLAENTGSFC